MADSLVDEMENESEGLSNETEFKKERKEIVEYRPGEPGQDCVSCEFFKEPDGCKKVTGQIFRSGTCNLFEGEILDPDAFGTDLDAVSDFLFEGE